MQLALFAFRLGRRRWETRRERDAGRVRGAAGRGVTMVWRIALRGAGSWGIGGLGGELSHLAFVKFTWSLPLLIIKQLTHEKGAGEHNLVPPGTAMCLGVA